MRISKVTTKTGDQGETGLGDGSRISKDHPNIVFLGDLDELNSHLGLAITACKSDGVRKQIQDIQQDLFNIGGEASMPGSDILLLNGDRVVDLEKVIIKMNETLPPLEEFILPGGDEFCARIHVSRAVCRRAERSCISLVKAGDNKKNWLPYLNRLSDFLFVLVRYTTQIQGGNETLWVR